MKGVPPPGPLGLSILIEWANVLHADRRHALEMLAAVAAQAGDLAQRRLDGVPPAPRAFLERFAAPIEILILYDGGRTPEVSVAEAARSCGTPPPPGVTVRLHDAPRCGYYAMKNRGAEVARGDYLVFIDSDVVPQAGWLAELLGTFAQTQTDVAAGETVLRTGCFYERAFAAGWFFLPTPDATGLQLAESYYANNLAMPRALFLRHPFPALPGTTRGACGYQAAILGHEGRRIVRNQSARALHPPPRRSDFFRRAIAQGRDYAMQNVLARTGRFPDLPRRPRLPKRLAISLLRVAAMPWYGRRVGLSLAETVPAMVLMSAFYLAVLGAEATTYLAPHRMQAPRFQI